MKQGTPHHRRRAGTARRLGPALAVLVVLLLSACSSRIGWGVITWTVKGTTARAGTIVPVYLKSNITKEYVIGLEDEGGARMEVPLWQLEFFGSKSAAEKRRKSMGSLASLYLVAARDGLPVREEPSNTADRAYRLRDGELVKALEIVEGETLYTGTTQLPGDWYKVMTIDGTKGYVFSYAMRLYDESSGEAPADKAEASEPESLDELFAKTWRPAWYLTMITEETFDLDYFALRFGLFGDAINRQMRVETPAISKVFQYSTITQENDWLIFGSTGLRIKFESPTSILVNWGGAADENPRDTAGWKSGDMSMRFIALDVDIRDLIRAEEARRSSDLRGFFSAVDSLSGSILDSAGVLRVTSPQGGSFSLWPSGLYAWNNAGSVTAGFPPSDGDEEDGQQGSAVFGLRMSRDLSLLWHGGFSLYPDSTGTRADYLYRLDARGIIMARAVAPEPGSPVAGVENRLGTISFSFIHQ